MTGCVCVHLCVFGQAILDVCDSSLARAVRTTIFVTSLTDAAAVVAIWRRATAPSPPHTHSPATHSADSTLCSVSVVQVDALPRGALVEFQVSALTKRAPLEDEVRVSNVVRWLL